MPRPPRRFHSTVTAPLRRSADDKILFGVCGGLAARFGIDPFWLRVGFVALALLFGKGVLLYIILAIAMPKTPAYDTSEVSRYAAAG